MGWFWGRKSRKMVENMQDLTDSVDVLAKNVKAILQDQRQLRGYVNAKMGNRLKKEIDDDEDDDDEHGDGVVPISVREFCKAHGVPISKVTPEMAAFIEETHDYKEWAQGQG